MFSFSFNIACLLFLILVSFFYFTKDKIKSSENEIYSKLIITSFVGLTIDIVGYTVMKSNVFFITNLQLIIGKIYLLYFLVWILVFKSYIVAIAYKDDKKTIRSIKISYIIFFVFLILNIFLKLNIVNTENTSYSSGLIVILLYTIVTIYIIYMIFLLLCHRKKLSLKEKMPLILFLVLGCIVMTIQFIFPEILLITGTECFITCLMYHTIENPDLKMIEELEISKELSEKANRAKTDFLSSMSHEIRTPLNAIVGFSECIENADDLEEAHNDARDVIQASKILLDIVNGILDISKIEAGKLEIVNSDYQSYELFNDVYKLIKPKMDEKAIDFQMSIGEDIPKILYGDHSNLKKIITNLLSNAYKYTDSGFVKYNVSCINNSNVCRLVISIEDSGRGIKEENINKLFTKFQRLEEDRNTTIEGTGLGLAITKQLVELMGGKIIVQSVYGSGSKFTVIIDQRIEKVIINKDSDKIDANIKVDLSNKNILVVDDNTLNLKVVTRLLEKYHPLITCCESGFECLDKISSFNYDLILLDDMMPRMSGMETLKKLKSIDGFNTPVVALTANAITGMREKYLSNGFDDYLSKPINNIELKELLIKYLINKDRTIDFGDLPDQVYEVGSVQTIPIAQSADDYINVSKTSCESYLKNNDVDIDNALSLLGDIKTYKEMLQEFIDNSDKKISKLGNYKNIKDMENYAIEVHSLKSDAKYLGFTKLADMALSHELKSKENNYDYVNDNYNQLEKEFRKDLEIAKEYLKDKM